MTSKKKLIIFLICYISYTSIYTARLNLSMASPLLIEKCLVNSAQIGIIGSVFSIVYALGRMINGTIGDKTAPWIMISIGLFFVGISNIIFGMFPPFIMLTVIWGINAFSQSMLWSSILKIISLTYDEKKAKKMTSYMVTSVALGNITGILFNTIIINKFGYKYAFFIPGIITIICCILVYSTTKNVNNNLSNKKSNSIISVIKNKGVQISLLPALFHGVIKDNISLWMAVYFVQRFSIDLTQTTYFVLLIPIVGFIGRLAYPFLYTLSKGREHLISIISFIICAILCLPLAMGNSSPVFCAIELGLVYALISIINTSFLSIFPMQYSEDGNVSSVSGIMDLVTYAGAGIGSFIYGITITKFGYESMYFSWVVISALSAVLLVPLLKKIK